MSDREPSDPPTGPPDPAGGAPARSDTRPLPRPDLSGRDVGARRPWYQETRVVIPVVVAVLVGVLAGAVAVAALRGGGGTSTVGAAGTASPTSGSGAGSASAAAPTPASPAPAPSGGTVAEGTATAFGSTIAGDKLSLVVDQAGPCVGPPSCRFVLTYRNDGVETEDESLAGDDLVLVDTAGRRFDAAIRHDIEFTLHPGAQRRVAVTFRDLPAGFSPQRLEGDTAGAEFAIPLR